MTDPDPSACADAHVGAPLGRRTLLKAAATAQAFVYQNAFTSIDPATGRPTYDPAHTPRTGDVISFCPSLSGGKNWPPPGRVIGWRVLAQPGERQLQF